MKDRLGQGTGGVGISASGQFRIFSSFAFFTTKRIAHAIILALWFACGINPSFVSAFALDLDNSQASPINRTLHPPVSVDTEIVSVHFGPSLYNIPRNYLAGVTQGRDANSYASFTIQVLLPDFAPRTRENAVQFNQVGWHNQFRALFEYGNHPRPQEDILDLYLKNAGMSKDDFRLVGSGYKLYENARIWPREIYTKEMPNGLFFFTCGTAKDGTPFPSCTIHETFEENVGVIYHFSRNYLDQASDIDLKLRALLQSFKKK
jgi:hypothetical protein